MFIKVIDNARWTIFALLVIILCACSASTPTGPSNVIIKEAWSRPAQVGQVGGAYMVIQNSGGADRVMRLASPISDGAEIHETKNENGMASMLPVIGGLEVPAGGSVELKPGGYHVMLMELKQELIAGEAYPLTLTMQSGAEITTTVEVRPN